MLLILQPSLQLQRSISAANAFVPTAAWGKRGLDRNKGMMGHPQTPSWVAQHQCPQSQGWNATRLVYYLPPPPLKDRIILAVVETHFSPRDSSLAFVSSPGPFPGSSLCRGGGQEPAGGCWGRVCACGRSPVPSTLHGPGFQPCWGHAALLATP